MDSTLEPFSQYDWDLCDNFCKVLQPCEEVTREMSAQNYVTASVVIPITRGLKTALENIDVSDNLIVDSFRQDLLSEIRRLFYNIEQSRTFALCMF